MYVFGKIQMSIMSISTTKLGRERPCYPSTRHSNPTLYYTIFSSSPLLPSLLLQDFLYSLEARFRPMALVSWLHGLWWFGGEAYLGDGSYCLSFSMAFICPSSWIFSSYGVFSTQVPTERNSRISINPKETEVSTGNTALVADRRIRIAGKEQHQHGTYHLRTPCSPPS